MTGTLVDLLVLLAVLAIVAVAAWYIMSQVALPDPIRKIVMIALVVLVAIIAIFALLRLAGHRIGANDPPFPVASRAAPAVSPGSALDMYAMLRLMRILP